jgi:protein-tyrosine phosphatase
MTDNQIRSCKKFRETCPLELGYFIQQPCPLALNRIAKNKGEPYCEWYINNAESNYCFWAFISQENNKKLHTFKDIADLTAMSVNGAKLAEVSAISRFRKLLIKNNQLRLFEDDANFEQIYEALKELQEV